MDERRKEEALPFKTAESDGIQRIERNALEKICAKTYQKYSEA